MPWGAGTALGGVLMAMALLFASVIASQGLTEAAGHKAVAGDLVDIFTKAGEVTIFADRALEAQSAGEPPPPAPELLADIVAARIFYLAAALSTLGLAIPIGLATRKGPRELVRIAGLSRWRWAWIWQPALWMLVAYAGVVAYSEIVRSAGLDVLVPDQPPPRAALRDGLTMALFGFLAVVAAPFGEEFLFRGLVFGGLARWGFWPGAVGLGFRFALPPIAPGTFIPFTGIGILFAWLFWRSRSLWPSIVCHACFNGLSFLVLLLSA